MDHLITFAGLRRGGWSRCLDQTPVRILALVQEGAGQGGTQGHQSIVSTRWAIGQGVEKRRGKGGPIPTGERFDHFEGKDKNRDQWADCWGWRPGGSKCKGLVGMCGELMLAIIVGVCNWRVFCGLQGTGAVIVRVCFTTRPPLPFPFSVYVSLIAQFKTQVYYHQCCYSRAGSPYFRSLCAGLSRV